MNKNRALITICGRGGSKGVPGKNVRNFLGKPLIAHTIQQAFDWAKFIKAQNGLEVDVLVSTDSEQIAEVARQYGAAVPFLRPAELSTDTCGKLPVISHALSAAESAFNSVYAFVLDLDPTSPVRTRDDIQSGYKMFSETEKEVVLSVVEARKNPYFNMLERDERGNVKIVKPLDKTTLSRQAAPQVWEANASIYFYKAAFLRTGPQSVWDGGVDIFEMPPESSFDIDEERDFLVAECMMKWALSKNRSDS